MKIIEIKAKTLQFIQAIRDCENYSLFASFEGKFNRVINKNSVKALEESMKESGFIGYITIIKTKAFGDGVKFYIADGQHRFEAAKNLGIPFNYEILELSEDTKEKATTFISRLNSTSVRWSTNNFMNSWIANDVHEYKVFKNCLETTCLKITDLLHIFLGGASKKEVLEFQSGKMKFANEKESLKLLAMVVEMSAYLPNKAFSRRALYKTLKIVKSPAKLAKMVIGSKYFIKIENETQLGQELQMMYSNVA